MDHENESSKENSYLPQTIVKQAIGVAFGPRFTCKESFSICYLNEQVNCQNFMLLCRTALRWAQSNWLDWFCIRPKWIWIEICQFRADCRFAGFFEKTNVLSNQRNTFQLIFYYYNNDRMCIVFLLNRLPTSQLYLSVALHCVLSAELVGNFTVFDNNVFEPNNLSIHFCYGTIDIRNRFYLCSTELNFFLSILHKWTITNRCCLATALF